MHNKIFNKGFTLVEVMIVGSIIALLAAIAIPAVIKTRLVANETLAKSTLRSIGNALEMYMAANSNYPTAESDLLSPTSNPPYLNRSYDGQTIRGYSYQYQFDSSGYTVVASPQNCKVTGSRTFTLHQNVITEVECTPE